ncbi:MAG: sucrase ferredoxin [Mycobacteriaceae bacterium]|uniref:sucrase ferredoxin n=1 Tax=Corynebacterium sp. TaxID=1720 RepID=UPI003F9E1ABC
MTSAITGTGPSKRAGACTVLSQASAEPLAGTAYTRDRWLLIEHPGPWPSRAVEDVLDADLLENIRARTPGIRVTLIRRPGARTVERPHAFTVTAGPQPRMRRIVLDSYDDLRDLDLATVGEVHTGPLFVVCTHGKREICCAEFGRPVVRAVDAAGLDVWEITHIGGDRFAAAMVAFPHGYFFGRLNPGTAVDAALAYTDGRLQPGNLRGLSGIPNSAQVADIAVREARGLTGVDDVEVTVVDEREVVSTVTLSVRGVPCTVDLVRGDYPEMVVNGCAPDSQPIVRRVWTVSGWRDTGSE